MNVLKFIVEDIRMSDLKTKLQIMFYLAFTVLCCVLIAILYLFYGYGYFERDLGKDEPICGVIEKFERNNVKSCIEMLDTCVGSLKSAHSQLKIYGEVIDELKSSNKIISCEPERSVPSE